MPTLRALKGTFRLGAVTDTAVMSSTEVRAALHGTGLDELLEVVITSSDVGSAKPDPRGIEAALARLGAAPGEALFVGDADVDADAARAAGVAFTRVGPDGLEAAVRRGLTAADGAWAAARSLVGDPDEEAGRSALTHQDLLTKPAGSLGRIEALGVQLAAIAGEYPPPRPDPAAVAVFAGDHGVARSGVTPWPQEVTGQMVANFVAGGAAINVLARQAGARVDRRRRRRGRRPRRARHRRRPGPPAPQRASRHGQPRRGAGDDRGRGAAGAGRRRRRRCPPGRRRGPLPGHRRDGHRQHHRRQRRSSPR